MPVYITKNALDNIPLSDDPVNNHSGKLKNLLLRSNPYLVGLAKNDTKFKPLKNGKENEAVRLIKVALNTIDDISDMFPGPNFDIPELDKNSFKFDDILEAAVDAFQAWSGIPQTGIVDSQTLLEIDSKFFGDEFFDAEKKKYIGKGSRKEFTFKEGQINANGKYEYNISFKEADQMILIETDVPLKGSVVKKNGSGTNQPLYINPSSASKKQILKDPRAKEIVKQYNPEFNNFTFIAGPQLKVEFKTGNTYTSQFIIDYNDEEAKTPPLQFNDPDAKLHKITAGETASQIVLDNYYGGQAIPINDPYNNTVITTLPVRTPFSVQNRSEDARFQFYLNLLYYYNSEDISGQTLKEWGLKKSASYQRYDVNHLDDVNVLDNKYAPADPHTGLPNYYRFLKRMETLNPASKIQFDVNGNCTSFETVTGQNIRIPSRKFADSLYNFLNYRSNEMLTPVVIPPTNVGDGPMSTVEHIIGSALDSIIDTVTDAIDTIGNVVSEVKQDAIILYHEVADFFIRAYNFAIQSLAQYWPRGAGGKIGLEGSITWGLPIKTEGRIEKALWRKTSKVDEFAIIFSKEFMLGVGAEEVVGTSFGLNSGYGKSKKNYGLDLGAGIQGGYRAIVSTEYEFPIRKDETALLSMIITVFGGTIVNATADLLEYLEFINLNPRQYLTKLEVALEGSASGWAAAQIGVDNENGIKVGDNKDLPAVQDKEKSYGSVDNIWSKLPGIGGNAVATFTAGVAFSYKADYDNNPLTFNHEGRVFSTIDLNVKLYVQAQLSTGLMGSFWQRLFLHNAPGTSGPETFFNGLNFDKGILLGVNYKLKRIDASDTISAGDFEYNIDPNNQNPNLIIDFITNGEVKYTSPNSKVVKQISAYLGTFSGDVDTLCEPGTEIKLNLNLGVLKQMWDQGTSYNYTFQNVFNLFRNIEYHKKVGVFNFDMRERKTLVKVKKVIPDKKLTDQVVDAHNKGDQSRKEVELTTYLLKSALEARGKKLGIEGGLALDIKMNLDFATIEKAFEFYLKKLYLKYALNQNLVDNNIAKHRVRINAALKTLGINNESGEVYYQKLFSDSIIPNTGVSGLLKYVNDSINSDSNHLTVNYFKALKNYIKCIKPYNSYLNNKLPSTAAEIKQDIDYGISETIEYFNFLAGLMQLEVTLEAKAGLSIGGHLTIGGDGLTGTVALTGLAELNYQAELYKKGVLTALDPTDPLRIIYDEIHKILGLPRTDKRIGAKTILTVLKK